jgi:hypothetical protein
MYLHHPAGIKKTLPHNYCTGNTHYVSSTPRDLKFLKIRELAIKNGSWNYVSGIDDNRH